jgi:hypothetical protein
MRHCLFNDEVEKLLKARLKQLGKNQKDIEGDKNRQSGNWP